MSTKFQGDEKPKAPEHARGASSLGDPTNSENEVEDSIHACLAPDQAQKIVEPVWRCTASRRETLLSSAVDGLALDLPTQGPQELDSQAMLDLSRADREKACRALQTLGIQTWSSAAQIETSRTPLPVDGACANRQQRMVELDGCGDKITTSLRTGSGPS